MGKGALYDSFIYPPFSVLDARAKWWQYRKRRWLDLGIDSGKGRKDELLSGYADAMTKWATVQGHAQEPADWMSKSIFDPVLAELLIAWFSPPNGRVLDPFAGGSVRGVVSALMGRSYLGVDISEDQITENREQAKRLNVANRARWKVGDAVRLYQSGVRGLHDMIMTCPPYGDLERYSDDPQDLSNMPYDLFLGGFRQAVKNAAARLAEDRFAVFVVGDFRDKEGINRGFVADTIAACRDAQLHFYNDGVLVTQIASLPLRVRGQFEGSRKLGKTHQNVLVFVKGDPKRATEHIGHVTPFTFPDP
ncbi:DNA methyltransferase [Roseibium sp. MB-4]